jgi:hypothetical protein
MSSETPICTSYSMRRVGWAVLMVTALVKRAELGMTTRRPS